MNFNPDSISKLGEQLVRRFSTPHISRSLWKAQPEHRDVPYMRALRLICAALSVPLPKFGRDDRDSVPWLALRAEQVTILRAYFTRTLPQAKANNCMRVLIEGMELVHAHKYITDDEMDAIYKAAGYKTTVETRKALAQAQAEAKKVLV
jgi:hypothetical protein